MRILHVITSLRTGGAEKLMTDLLPRMRDCEVEVELCVFDGARTPFYEMLEKKGVKIYALSSSVYSLVNLWKLIWLIRKFDVVHAHNTACQYYVAIAGWFADCHMVTTEHSTSNRRRGKWWLKPFDWWLYRQFDNVICVSDIVSKNIHNYVGENGVNTTVVPNGININEYIHYEAYCDVLSGYKGKRGLMVAGFRYEKDQQTVIKAFNLLPSNYHLFLVGDGDKKEDIELLIEELNLGERVHLLGVRKDVKDLLKAVDVVIMSSHREGLSLSSLEGMASGRPFIASDVDGLRDIVGGYGVLFPHEDYKALADEIRKLCEDEEYAEEVAVRCQERAKMFDISVMVEKYMEVYHSLG